MGQKVNPHGFRVGVISDWDSRWYASNEKVGDLLVEDYKIRKFLKDSLYAAGVPRIEIERDSTKVKIFLHCARPGMVIGRGGQEIESLRKKLETMISKPVALNIIEIRSPDLNAQLVAENIASQLEKRISYRRAMKQAMGRSMKLGAKGIKTMVSGRLGGAEIARTDHYNEGTIPLQTIRADIDYGFAEAKTTYGRIGVKVWIYKGEVLQSSGHKLSRSIEPQQRRDNRGRRDNRDNRDNRGRRDNRAGGDRSQGQGGYGQRQGGYNNQNRPQGQGGYNNQNRPQGQGGYNNQNRQGGYNNQNRQGGYNTQNRAPSAPADNAAHKEGGDR